MGHQLDGLRVPFFQDIQTSCFLAQLPKTVVSEIFHQTALCNIQFHKRAQPRIPMEEWSSYASCSKRVHSSLRVSFRQEGRDKHLVCEFLTRKASIKDLKSGARAGHFLALCLAIPIGIDCICGTFDRLYKTGSHLYLSIIILLWYNEVVWLTVEY